MGAFIPDASFLKLLGESEELQEVLDERAEAVAAEARTIAPRGSGNYADNIVVEKPQDVAGPASRVVADDPTGAAGIIEFGTEDTPAFAPLRRALDAVMGTDSLASE